MSNTIRNFRSFSYRTSLERQKIGTYKFCEISTSSKSCQWPNNVYGMRHITTPEHSRSTLSTWQISSMFFIKLWLNAWRNFDPSICSCNRPVVTCVYQIIYEIDRLEISIMNPCCVLVTHTLKPVTFLKRSERTLTWEIYFHQFQHQ